MNKWVKVIISILICQMAGFIGSIFTSPSIQTWYVGLQKPAFAPPNWVFAPAWISLFTLMGISLYLVWNKKKNIKTPLVLFSVQLVLNMMWSFLFFGLKSPFYALVEIIILWIAILLTIISFYKVSKRAGILLLPYILWVSFATILNYYIWLLNI